MTATKRALTQQSNTAEKLMDADGMNTNTLIDMIRLGSGNPTLESMGRLARTALGGQGQKTAAGTGEVLGQTNPAAQIKSINDMKRLNDTLNMLNRRSLTRGGSLGSFVGTETPTSILEAAQASRRRRNFSR